MAMCQLFPDASQEIAGKNTNFSFKDLVLKSITFLRYALGEQLHRNKWAAILESPVLGLSH